VFRRDCVCCYCLCSCCAIVVDVVFDYVGGVIVAVSIAVHGVGCTCVVDVGVGDVVFGVYVVVVVIIDIVVVTYSIGGYVVVIVGVTVGAGSIDYVDVVIIGGVSVRHVCVGVHVGSGRAVAVDRRSGLCYVDVRCVVNGGDVVCSATCISCVGGGGVVDVMCGWRCCCI